MPAFTSSDILVLAFLGFVCSDSATIFQIYGQRFIEPATASIVYLFEPVLATIFSFSLLGEVMNVNEMLGAALIITAMLVAATEKEVVKQSLLPNE